MSPFAPPVRKQPLFDGSQDDVVGEYLGMKLARWGEAERSLRLLEIAHFYELQLQPPIRMDRSGPWR